MCADNRPSYSVISVDDEPIVHQMLKQFFIESHLPIALIGSANSGSEALELITRLRPDICLLDIHMDGMDGLELASILRKTLNYHPRIIYLTAYNRFEYAQKAIRLESDDYILKPINRNELLSTLHRVIAVLQSQRLSELEKDRLKRRVKSVIPSAIADATTADCDRNTTIAKTVRSYIDLHHREKLTLELVASHVNLSTGYVGSIFKSAFGLSFRAYLRSVRIAKAKKLLQNPAYNISEIALEVGYDDLNYFSQAFFKETGIRPSEYRGGGRMWAK
jgi:two-component system response regulator YesN